MRSILASFPVLLCLATPILGQAVASGPDFQINTYTTSAQSRPDVAMNASGRFVVVWASFGSATTDTNNFSIAARRFDANLMPLGNDFQVNTYTDLAQDDPAAAIAGDGDFVLVWESAGSNDDDDSGDSVQSQRYLSTGSTAGSELQVNAVTLNDQEDSVVATAPDGRFVVVWESGSSNDTDTSSLSIQAQLFDSSGLPVGSQFQVNSYTTNSQSNPAVAMDGSGNFVVAWEGPESSGAYGSYNGIHLQRFDSSGAPRGAETQVNSFTSGSQQLPSVAMTPSGAFAVVWRSPGSFGNDGEGQSVQARAFDASGVPRAADFQINTYTTGNQQAADIAAGPDGDFVVVWHAKYSDLGDDGDYTIIGRLLDRTGVPSGSEFRVNSFITAAQANPAVASDGDGNFIVVWRSDQGPAGEDNDNSAIRARPFSGLLPDPTIFTDGFETANTSLWSSISP